MRVTDRALYERASYQLAQSRSASDVASQQMASGLRISHPSDDSPGSALAVETAAEISSHASRQSSLSSAVTELNAADSALSNVTDALRRSYELALQLGSDTYSATDRQQASIEVEGLMKQVVGQLNSKVGNRFIFGGTVDDSSPFADDGSYLGDENPRQLEVAPGIRETVSVNAKLLMNDPKGVDVFSTLQTLRDALLANDGNGIRSVVGSLNNGISQVVTGREQAGATTSVIELASVTAQAMKDDAAVRRGRLTDVDAVDAATRVALGQRALEAAMAAATKSFELTLLNRLR
jgi:flagellar hook-associated protein 3 FlgL